MRSLLKNFSVHIDRFRYPFLFVALLAFAEFFDWGLGAAIDQGYKFQKDIGSPSWTAAPIQLAAGEYFVSLGRPRGACEILVDDKVTASTRAALEGVRQGLGLSSSFVLSLDSLGPKIQVRCVAESTASSPVGLAHSPIVSRFKVGQGLQLFRTFRELAMAPLISILLLVILFIQGDQKSSQRKRMRKKETTKKKYFKIILILLAPITKLWALTKTTLLSIQSSKKTNRNIREIHYAFGWISLFYFLSLSHYPRLFIQGDLAFLGHIVLRHYFAIATFGFIETFGGEKLSFLSRLHFFALIIAIATYFFDPKSLTTVYLWQCFLFPTALFFCYVILLRNSSRQRNIAILEGAVFSAATYQGLDLIKAWTGFGSFSTTYLLALFTTALGAVAYKEGERSKAINLTIPRLLRITSEAKDVSVAIALAGKESQGLTSFERVSGFCDGFALGKCANSGERLFRIFGIGYGAKMYVDERDWEVDLRDERGQIMCKALQNQNILTGTGNVDGAAYAVVAIGKYVCLNFSDKSPRLTSSVLDDVEVIRRLQPGFIPLRDQLVELASKKSIRLEKIRALKGGLGTWREEIGAIFIDAAKFTKIVSLDATGSFVKFFKEKYIVSLLRAVGMNAEREFSRGDELYLVVLADLIPAGMSVKEALQGALVSLDSFINGSGADMCIEHGFSPIKFKIGAALGAGSVIVSENEVTTGGPSVNEAKRWQERAAAGQILVGKSVISEGLQKKFTAGSVEFILVKENYFEGHRLYSNQKNQKIPA